MQSWLDETGIILVILFDMNIFVIDMSKIDIRIFAALRNTIAPENRAMLKRNDVYNDDEP